MVEIKSLIDPEGGLIDRRIFADREIYQLERERIFARCWLYLGHECEIPNPGDFVTAYMGEEPVILWRDLNRQVHAYLNVCRHRGNRVCRADRGNNEVERLARRGEVRRKAPFVSDRSVVAGALECGFQRVEDFRAHAQGFGKSSLRAFWQAASAAAAARFNSAKRFLARWFNTRIPTGKFTITPASWERRMRRGPW